jgi:hypothetical protein
LLFSAFISRYSFVVVFAVDSTIDSRFVTVLAVDYKPSQAKSSQAKSFEVQATFDCQQSITPKAKTVRSYKASLVKFLSFLDGTYHPHDYKAMDERLLEIQDTDVVRFLNWETYHEEAPDVDARPTYLLSRIELALA